MFFLEHFRATKLVSSAFESGPGSYRKVDETWEKISAKIWAGNCGTVRSDDQKSEYVHEY